MKKLIALLLATLMVFSMAACNGKAKDSSTPTADSSAPSSDAGPAEPVTIKFANYAILEAGYTEFWEGVKSGFEAKYPNIKIEWVSAPYGEIVNQVINMAGGGDKVDLMFSELSWTPTLEEAGLAAPIGTILSKEFIDDFYPSVIEAATIKGKAYSIPMYISPYVLYYNKELFKQAGLDPEQPPKTYDEMLKMAEKLSTLKTKDGNKVYAFGQTTASVPVSGSSLTAMVYNFGGNVLNADGQLDIDNQGFKDAFSMIKTLDEKGYNPQNSKLKDLRNLFALGQLAMYYDQSWGFNGVKSINPEAENFIASAAPLSGGSGTGESLLQDHSLILMDNGDAKKEAVRLLVEYLITPEMLADYMSTITPAFPAKKSMENMDTIVNNKILKGAVGSVSKVKSITSIPTLSDLNLELCTLAQSVTVGGKSVEQGIADFQAAAEGIVG
ncbi:multiple sugar transport system substrate-binding protein [Hydrogenoanaerobacterium saccharovorans]|uniref:Multiple sugar transport system substrate-binding protein n=1 Tax=Hydrogenoanaerobacterium saccharovorans TaxID=474960 RepID=A0A1H7YSN9_9FIRM|nr:extracellular solute-binding protein [Hydrogenoanaerobacterium saccharovorans]RPF49029.1 multiple sugar transport system substrate-binding protein [Hydrogenoanaerobacterium saccharovorans]SEM49252.1 multiple sugar transport system substrate-binding protein [Hydrogenoanaerobacterium saccharovorans]